MEVSRGRRYAKGRCGLILLLLLSSIFFCRFGNFFFLKRLFVPLQLKTHTQHFKGRYHTRRLGHHEVAGVE